MADDQEPGTSPMGGQDMAESNAYYQEAATLHGKASVEESQAVMMDVIGMGTDLHTQAAADEVHAADDETRGWRMYTAAQERDWAMDAENERHAVAQRAEAAAAAGQANAPDHDLQQTDHQATEQAVARAEEAALRQRALALQQQEDGMIKMAQDDERFGHNGEPPKPAP
jgi:hypothetical protein